MGLKRAVYLLIIDGRLKREPELSCGDILIEKLAILGRGLAITFTAATGVTSAASGAKLEFRKCASFDLDTSSACELGWLSAPAACEAEAAA